MQDLQRANITANGSVHTAHKGMQVEVNVHKGMQVEVPTGSSNDLTFSGE